VFVIIAALVDRLYRGQPRPREDEKFQLQGKVDEVLHILRGLMADRPDSRASSATDTQRGSHICAKIVPFNGDTKDCDRVTASSAADTGRLNDHSVYSKVTPFDEIENTQGAQAIDFAESSEFI